MTTRERLATAALVSLVLHAFVVAGHWVAVPEPPLPLARLEARLILVPPAPPPVEQPAPPPRVRERRAAVPAPPVTASDLPRQAALPAGPAAEPITAAQGPSALPEPEREQEAAGEPAVPAPPQRLALAIESGAAVPAVRSLPRRGRIAFNLVYGADRYPVGKVVQTWEVEGGAYLLSSDAETSGIVDLFRPQRLRYISKGRVVSQGLRPDSFLVSRTRRGQNEASQARFDWSAGELLYGSATGQKRAALPAGTHDLMSLIYQFSLSPPAPGRHRLPITTGTRFEVYDIEVAAEESIETPLGTLRTLPVKQLARAGAESIEFWLAAEYRYLPVRIRHYDREGNFSGEQVVSEIRVSED